MERIIVSFVILTTLPVWGADSHWEKSKDLPEKAGYSTVIEAEEYDHGQNDAIQGQVFKSEKGTVYLGSITPGEFASYSVKNPTDGNFDIEIRTSSAFEAASIIFEIDGKDHMLSVPYSGDWDSWRQTTLMSVPLHKGQNNIKLKTNTGNFYIDSFRLIRRPK